jgi:hypothetical protein
MTEWMVYSLPKDQLNEARVTETVDFLENLMWRNRNNDLAIGPKGHALHALVIYQQRMFGAQPGQWSVRLAKKNEPKK